MNKKTLLKLFTISIISILFLTSFSIVNAVETRIRLDDLGEEEFNSLLRNDINFEEEFGLDDERFLFEDSFEDFYDDSFDDFSLEERKELENLGISMAFGEDGEVFLSDEFEATLEELGEEIYELFTNPIFNTAMVAFFSFVLIIIVSNVVVSLIRLIAKWKVHTKAGKPGWAVFLPIYRNVVIFEIAGISPALLLLYYLVIIPFFGFFVIPIVSLILKIVLAINISKKFGKSGGFAVGLIFLPTIFYAILGFGKAEYIDEEKEVEKKTEKTVIKEETKVIAAEVKPVEEVKEEKETEKTTTKKVEAEVKKETKEEPKKETKKEVEKEAKEE